MSFFKFSKPLKSLDFHANGALTFLKTSLTPPPVIYKLQVTVYK
jgi:hypothetical protein